MCGVRLLHTTALRAPSATAPHRFGQGPAPNCAAAPVLRGQDAAVSGGGPGWGCPLTARRTSGGARHVASEIAAFRRQCATHRRQCAALVTPMCSVIVRGMRTVFKRTVCTRRCGQSRHRELKNVCQYQLSLHDLMTSQCLVSTPPLAYQGAKQTRQH